jgi:hypothetical protein
MRFHRLLPIILAILVAALPAEARARCGGTRPLAEDVADPEQIAFVGTVERTNEGGFQALFRVEEVWSGPDLPVWLWVDGSIMSDPGPFDDFFGIFAAIEEDARDWVLGERYLVFPWNPVWPDGDELARYGSTADSSCSNTQPWDEAFADLRPATVRAPFAVDQPGGSIPVPVLIAGAGVLVLAAGVGAMALRARRRAS